MKLLVAVSLVFLAGCSFIMPRPHDPVMFGDMVDLKIELNKLTCTDKKWNTAMSKVERIKIYSTLRKDPQAQALSDLEEALKKAQASSNDRFCEGVLKLQKTRVDVIADAWRGR